MNIEWVPIDSIRPAPWRSTYMLKPDMKVLATSMAEHGWLSYLVVRRADSTIIDGFHRWAIAQQDKTFARHQQNKTVPVLFVDCDEVDARVLHVQMNRPRAAVVAKFLSSLVRDIIRSRKYDIKQVRDLFNMGVEEIELLMNGTLLKVRKISEHKYSKAWVPVEAPAKSAVDTVVIERPPNSDR